MSLPEYRGWEIIRPLGAGGQGEVLLARSPDRALKRREANTAVQSMVVRLSGVGEGSKHEVAAEKLADAVVTYSRPEAPDELGALKQFRMPTEGEEAGRAIQRFKNEINALKMIEGDPAALRVLAFDADQHWMLTDYHPAGSLSKYPWMFKGQVYRALRALRPIISLLAKLHQRGIVHRDIKPQNILVRSDGGLVLGDFGIVFLEAGNRPTEILERVGSRDWMAPWAQTGMRVDDVNQSFDVFPLGKVIWSMISGMPMLPYWYHHRPAYELTKLFPNDPTMHIANRILDHCIVEHEEECVPTAGALLSMVDQFITMLANGGQLLGDGIPRPCRVCGIGQYQMASKRFPLPGSPDWDIYACDYCDHIQFFGRSTPTRQS